MADQTLIPTPMDSDPDPVPEPLIFDPKPTHEAKIRELLRNINSIELKLCSDGSKEFIKLLRGSTGGELLHEYVRTSSQFTELLEVWNRRKGKPGFSYVMSLVAVILAHSEGVYRVNDPGRVAISRVLDKFARSIVEERLEDLYRELNSKEGKRQKAALGLIASVVRRGSLLAAEVAKCFDFKLPVLGKLSEYNRNKRGGTGGGEKRKHSTRNAFVEFAMSFLEAGKPGLLRWVLQQREIFSGILRGLGSDDEETVVYVLSTLRDRVLTDESGVSPGLRSVLFGSVTLEQMVEISGREGGGGGVDARIAYEVLVMVCTDPSNGLMPDLDRQPSPLKGNVKRLVGVMKKLRATEVRYHRDLLLAIVNGRPLLGSSYLEEFPYNLEDNASPIWVSAVTLAADVVRSVRAGISWDFLNHRDPDVLSFESSEVQSVFKCVCPRPFSRLVVNKGLLHSNPLIKHGTLRLVLELLRLFDSFIRALSVERFASLKQRVQDEVRILLPDPQVLFTLLSSVSSVYQSSKPASKRKADSESMAQHKSAATKKLKINDIDDDVDIVVGGLDSASGDTLPKESEEKQRKGGQFGYEELIEIWGSSEDSFSSDDVKNADVYFYCRVLEAFKIFHATLREVLEVSFDFLKILPSNPLELPSILLQALLSMLIEHLGCSNDFSSRVLPPIYKHLPSFLNLSINSSVQDIKQQADILAKAAMRSTGAFDHSLWEVGTWFLCLPGYDAHDHCGEHQESELFKGLSSPVVSFLCDAVSTLGNNLVNYWAPLKCRLSNMKVVQEKSVDFSPLVTCVLEKCLRLLSSESGAFSLPEKSMISLYVCNTLKHLLQTQVEAGILAAVIHDLLSERSKDHICAADSAENCLSEWRPLVNLHLFSRSILSKETFKACTVERVALDTNSPFVNTITEVKSFLSAGVPEVFGISKALYFAVICTTADDILENLPSLMAISGKLPGFHKSFMSYFFHDQSLMNRVSKLWPDMFSSGLRISLAASAQLGQDVGNQTSVRSQCTDFESLEYASFQFASFLKQAPFYLLFPAIVGGGLEYYSEIKELLVAKLSNLQDEQIVSSLRLVLFWFHQVQSSYRKKPSKQQEHVSQLCYVLVEHILAKLSTLKVKSGFSTAVAKPLALCIAKTVFCHPAVPEALSCSFGHDYELSEEVLRGGSEALLSFCGERICEMERRVSKLLVATCDCLLALCGGEKPLSGNIESQDNVLRNFRRLVQWIFSIFKEKIVLWYRSQDASFFPVLYAILALRRFISPIELLELADWMLAGVQQFDLALQEASSVSPVCLGFSIACAAFDMLSDYLQPLNVKAAVSDFFWAIRQGSFKLTLFESIYFKAFESATSFKIDFADICLFKALRAAHSLTSRRGLLPLNMDVMRLIACTSTKVLSHCIQRTNNTKAKLLSLMTKISPLHLSAFGHLFSDILSKDLVCRGKFAAESNNQALSDEEYLMLMPAALSYIDSSRRRLQEHAFRKLEFVPSFYSRILLKGFRNWKYFVSQSLFQMEFGEFLLLSVEKLHDFFRNSLLGKAVQMLQWHLASGGAKKKKRLNLFCSLCPCSGSLNDFMDFDIGEASSYSVEDLLSLVNRAVAKVSLSLVLLFPEGNGNSLSKKAHKEEPESVLGSDEEESLGMRFLDLLISIWQRIVKKLPITSDDPEQGSMFLLLRFLEVFMLRCIYRLTTKMQKYLIKMNSLPFLEKMAKVSLLHRFADPTTLETLRDILSSLSSGNLPVAFFLQLLLGHSQLAPTVDTVVESSNFAAAGMLVKPLSSFLRPTMVLTERMESENCKRHKGLLEVIKLLRLLFHLKAHGRCSVSEDNIGVNSREVLSLLLPAYGATVSEIDLEIYGLLSEIESACGVDHKIIADLDYLWGSAALRVRKEHPIEQLLLDDDMVDAEEDQRRSQFRDNLPINSNLLVGTILYFPYERTVSEKSMFLDMAHQDNFANTVQGHSAELGRLNRYDPVFLLPFSAHALSMGYLDPVEFVGLGLLAIALVSIASPEEGVRKLGYEVLGRFKDALKGCQKKREVTRLKLLLTYLQNGIEEPWQRIPTVAAIFVAEASVILLDLSHDRYSAISKFLMVSPRMNLKSIPLFHDVIWSSSVNFRTDRLWVLRLLYAGINLEDDAQIYIRNSVLEILLSVYASPLSDNETKELILQVVSKCIRVQKMARYLIESCCLISWLCSVLSLSLSHNDGHDKMVAKQWIMLLEVIHVIVSSRSTMEWLQTHALEQLSDLSCHLFDLLIRFSKLGQETGLVIVILEIIVSTLKISQEREIYQTHYTLSMRSLSNLYQAVDLHDSENYRRSAELGLKAILTSIPPTNISDLDQEELSDFLMWAVSTAGQSDPVEASQQTESSSLFKMCVEEHKQDDSLVSTLLRWLVASVIRRWISSSHNGSDPRSALKGANRETLLSFLTDPRNSCQEAKLPSDSGEFLAKTIFHLQQLIGTKFRELPSVVAALSILLLTDQSNTAGSATTLPMLRRCASSVHLLWSKIRSPSEANAAWRWSSDQPWADLTTELTDLEKTVELHACQSLLVILSGELRKRPSKYQLLTPAELESSGLFEWEITQLQEE